MDGSWASLRGTYFKRVEEYWQAMHNQNVRLASSIFFELEFLSNQTSLARRQRTSYSRQKRRRLLWASVPALFAAMLVVGLIVTTYEGWLPQKQRDQIDSQVAYNINLVEILVGGAVAFASILAALTYAGRDDPPTSDLEGDALPFSLPPSPDEILRRQRDRALQDPNQGI